MTFETLVIAAAIVYVSAAIICTTLAYKIGLLDYEMVAGCFMFGALTFAVLVFGLR